MRMKDYELIARGLYVSRLQSVWSATEINYADQHRAAALHVAMALAKGNPRFDMNKFMKECGVEEINK